MLGRPSLHSCGMHCDALETMASVVNVQTWLGCLVHDGARKLLVNGAGEVCGEDRARLTFRSFRACNDRRSSVLTG